MRRITIIIKFDFNSMLTLSRGIKSRTTIANCQVCRTSNWCCFLKCITRQSSWRPPEKHTKAMEKPRKNSNASYGDKQHNNNSSHGNKEEKANKCTNMISKILVSSFLNLATKIDRWTWGTYMETYLLILYETVFTCAICQKHLMT